MTRFAAIPLTLYLTFQPLSLLKTLSWVQIRTTFIFYEQGICQDPIVDHIAGYIWSTCEQARGCKAQEMRNRGHVSLASLLLYSHNKWYIYETTAQAALYYFMNARVCPWTLISTQCNELDNQRAHMLNDMHLVMSCKAFSLEIASQADPSLNIIF